MTDTQHPARDALKAVQEALAIPHAATVGDEKIRAKILDERTMHAVVMLDSILERGRPPEDVARSVAYLRERLAEHPAEGYTTWDQAVAERAEREASSQKIAEEKRGEKEAGA